MSDYNDVYERSTTAELTTCEISVGLGQRGNNYVSISLVVAWTSTHPALSITRTIVSYSHLISNNIDSRPKASIGYLLGTITYRYTEAGS
jgi:hypothetical protein